MNKDWNYLEYLKSTNVIQYGSRGLSKSKSGNTLAISAKNTLKPLIIDSQGGISLGKHPSDKPHPPQQQGIDTRSMCFNRIRLGLHDASGYENFEFGEDRRRVRGEEVVEGGKPPLRPLKLPPPFQHTEPLTNSALAKSPTLSEKSNLPHHLSNLINLREKIAEQERRDKEGRQEEVKRLIEMQKNAED